MRPTFQGLRWFECYGLGEDELFIRFCLIHDLENLLCFYFFLSLGAKPVQVLLRTINVGRITLLRSVFTAYSLVSSNKIILYETW
jgi:hypothetical protein